jgi:hypothetical protein
MPAKIRRIFEAEFIPYPGCGGGSLLRRRFFVERGKRADSWTSPGIAQV